MMGSAPHMGMNLGQEDELTLSVETGEDDIQGKLANITKHWHMTPPADLKTPTLQGGQGNSYCIEFYLVLKLEMQLFKYIKYFRKHVWRT